MKKYLRAIQTLFPAAQDIRFSGTCNLMRLIKIPCETDFYALNRFQPSPEQVFIDVGANRGLTIESMLLIAPGANRIIGFEPNLLIFDKLKNNPCIRKNSRVDLYQLGLGNQQGRLPLYVPYYRKWMFDGLASFNYEEASNWLPDRLWHFKPEKLKIKEIECRISRLDDFNFNPYFIKIDVQGFELQVLTGGEQTLRKHYPILLIESMNDQIAEFLKQLDYSFFYYHKGKFLKGFGKLNTFCITKDKFATLTR